MNHNREHLNSAWAAFVPGIRFIGIKAAEKGKSRCNERVGRGFAFGLTLIRCTINPQCFSSCSRCRGEYARRLPFGKANACMALSE